MRVVLVLVGPSPELQHLALHRVDVLVALLGVGELRAPVLAERDVSALDVELRPGGDELHEDVADTRPREVDDRLAVQHPRGAVGLLGGVVDEQRVEAADEQHRRAVSHRAGLPGGAVDGHEGLTVLVVRRVEGGRSGQSADVDALAQVHCVLLPLAMGECEVVCTTGPLTQVKLFSLVLRMLRRHGLGRGPRWRGRRQRSSACPRPWR